MSALVSVRTLSVPALPPASGLSDADLDLLAAWDTHDHLSMRGDDTTAPRTPIR